MKRYFDFVFVAIMAVVLFVPMILITLLIKLTSKGPIPYWSDRVGIKNKVFKMPKFRSMRTGTPDVATHLLSDPNIYL